MWAPSSTIRAAAHLPLLGGVGDDGVRLPAAIGAQVAMPGRLVVDIAGDGSIQMNIQELATAVQYRVPVKVVILNNGRWDGPPVAGALLRRELFADMPPRIPDFVKLARRTGRKGSAPRSRRRSPTCSARVRRRRTGADRRDHGSRRDGLPDGPRGSGADRDAAGLTTAAREERIAMRHTISVLVENEFGVLSRVSGLFSGRGSTSNRSAWRRRWSRRSPG